jgi:hypothetical protein
METPVRAPSDSILSSTYWQCPSPPPIRVGAAPVMVPFKLSGVTTKCTRSSFQVPEISTRPSAESTSSATRPPAVPVSSSALICKFTDSLLRNPKAVPFLNSMEAVDPTRRAGRTLKVVQLPPRLSPTSTPIFGPGG